MNPISELFPSLSFNAWAAELVRRNFPSERAIDIYALCEAMMASDGEYSSLLLAQEILQEYSRLDAAGRIAFFFKLDSDYDVDIEVLIKATRDYKNSPTFESLNHLTKSSEPKRQELLRRLNMPDGVTPQLVKMREDLLALSRTHPELAKIDADFRHLFRAWFNRGFLYMRPLDWSSPANILEKIVSYEAVHAISNMEELRARVAPRDRLCYAFFHPAMEGEPLVFIEVALTKNLSNNIAEILDPRHEDINPEEANHAIFYSISNCHQGLAGVSFGNLLIKQMVALLVVKFPNIKTYATLSPAPGFSKWLKNSERPDLSISLAANENTQNALLVENSELLKSAAEYFLHAKNERGKPLDPVARFHLNNGAELARLNLHADSSEKGEKQSMGLMVNYIYSLKNITDNHERYVGEGEIACAKSISNLLK
ncbi:MAG: malonyl-CoA decarboxylase [Cryomorphaceae bacterium]|jgi:malonyl-CoA decarboxylase